MAEKGRGEKRFGGGGGGQLKKAQQGRKGREEAKRKSGWMGQLHILGVSVFWLSVNT